MSKCYLYLRTSSDDRGVKLGIDVQRQGCLEFISRSGMELAREFVDDGYTVSILMDLRTAGAELVKAVAENGVKAVVVWNGELIGRIQPIFWQFIGLCRAKSTAPDEPVPQSSDENGNGPANLVDKTLQF